MDATRQGLVWGIKYQFLKYIERMPDGQVTLSGGAERLPSGEFFFPAGMKGQVQFRAHGGALDLTISEPRIDGDVLIVGGSPLARITWAEPGRSERVELTAQGAQLFNGVYPEGERLDAVWLAP